MKEWEAKVLGFTSAWWLLALAFIGGAWLGISPVAGLMGLAVGAIVALFVATAENATVGRVFAIWFLRGVLSMVALPCITIVLTILLQLCAALVSR